MKKKGSSLLLVMIIVAGIMVVVFGTQRLALVQFSQSARDEDNQIAYYAAKAGIEDGLLRFRFNRDVETISDGNDNEWFNLSDGVAVGSLSDSGKPDDFNPNSEYYALKISYRGSTLGNFSDKSTWKAVSKDSVLELSGFPNVDRDYFLRYMIKFSANSSSCYAQLQQIRTLASGTVSSYEVYKADSTAGDYDSRNNNLPIRTDVGAIKALSNTVRIRAIGCDLAIAAQTVTGSSSTTAAGVDFDNLKTTITSTGYFGSTKRTLIAEIDRLSGTLLGVYDMTLYGGTGKVGK